MMEINRSVAEVVRKTFSDCIDRDMLNLGRFDAADRSKYTAPFEQYREDYAPVEKQGVRLLNPDDFNYSRGRGGECADFVLHMLGISYLPEELAVKIDQILEFPIIDDPIEGSLVIYYTAPPEALRMFGNGTHL